MIKHALLPALIALAGAAAPAGATDYVVIRKEILVERSADAVWKRVGDYCAIAEWLKVKCEIVPGSGTGDVGTIRRLNDTTLEPMVARTAHSYTYSQIAGGMTGFAYNGTLAVEPVAANRSKITYTLIYDAALMPSDEARKAQFDRANPRFQGAIETMKALAEAEK